MILVTGARGWIGGRLIETLGEGARAFEGDTRDDDAVRAQLAGCDAIVHTAFKNIDHDGSGFQANVDGSAVLAGAAAAADLQLVSLSTCGVYGHAPHRLADESTPLDPDTPLSRSRARVDADLVARHAAGQPVLVVRHRFVIGPGDDAVIPRLHRVVARSPFWLDGGRAQLSLIHVDDLVAILIRAARGPLPDHAVMHATDGRPHTLRRLGEQLCARLGGSPPRLSLPLSAVLGPVRLWERLAGIDPETSTATMSSIRLRLVAQDQSFDNARQRAFWPDQPLRTLDEALDAYGSDGA